MSTIETSRELITGQIVWLVDGDDMKRENLQDSLRQHGYAVSTFENIASVLTNSAQTDRFVIVTAERLPDGYFGDLINRLKSNQMILSTIVTSLDGTIERAVDAFRHGAQDYLVEPYSSFDLIEVIQRSLNNAKKQEELAA